MDYPKIIDIETPIAEEIFSIISELEQTTYETDPVFSNYVEASKKALQSILMSYKEQEDESGYKFYSNGFIKYYQNGLCVMKESKILLAPFGEIKNSNSNAINEQAMNLANEINLPFVSAQLKNFADPTYKFSQIYNGMKGSFERITSNCEFIEKDLTDDVIEVHEEMKKLLNNVIEKLAPTKIFYIIKPDKVKEYAETQNDDCLIQVPLEDDAVKSARLIIDTIYDQDEVAIDIARRMRILNR